MILSKSAYSSVQRMLRNRVFSVKASKLWTEIHNELGVGDLSAKELTFSQDDHEKIRAWYIREVAADPLTTDVGGDRLQTAALVRDEKWASENVFSGMISVNMISGYIPLKQGNALTPVSTLIQVNASDIITDEINAVILVENGIIARHWHECRYPQELSGALMVYRGHGSQETKAVRQWLKTLPKHINKIGYFDFDPAGLGMAIDYDMGSILIPDPLTDEMIEGINNKPECHVLQLSQRANLANQLPISLIKIWQWMSSEGRQCAVTQERLLIMKWQLKEIKLLN